MLYRVCGRGNGRIYKPHPSPRGKSRDARWRTAYHNLAGGDGKACYRALAPKQEGAYPASSIFKNPIPRLVFFSVRLGAISLH
jgi:hypothetical protein